MLQKILSNIQAIAKTIGIVAIIVICLYLYFHFRGCSQPPSVSSGGIETPKDSSFMPVHENTYTPPSIPILEHRKLPVKLPHGVQETDVHQVITVVTKPASRDSSSRESRTTNIIETNDGEVFVERDSIIEEVIQTKILPPVVQICVGIGLGTNIDQDRHWHAHVAYPFLLWFGRVHVPVIEGDWDGISIGGDVRLYHDVFLGATYGSAEIRAGLTYYF